MIFSDALIDKSIIFFKKLLNDSFFRNSEKLCEAAATYATPASAVIGLLMALTFAVKTDSFSVFLMGFVWVVLLAILYYIGSRFLNSCKALIRNNRSEISNKEYLNILGLIAILTLEAVVVGGAYMSIKFSAIDPIKWALVASIPILYGICMLLNPTLITTYVTKNATAGEDALAIGVLFLKINTKLAGILFGSCVSIGSVLLAMTWFQLMGGNAYDLLDAGGRGLIGVYFVIGGLLAPFALYLGFIMSYLVIDILKAILTLNNQKDNNDVENMTEEYEVVAEVATGDVSIPSLNLAPGSAKKVITAIVALSVLGVLGYGGWQVKLQMDAKSEIARQEEAERAKVESTKKELVIQAGQFVGRGANEFVSLQNSKAYFPLILGDEYSNFARSFGDFSIVENVDGQVLGYGCVRGRCGSDEAAFVVDTQTGQIYAALGTAGLARYYGVPSGQPVPSAFNKWKQEQNLADAPR